MSEWRKITIGDLGKIVTGKTPSTKNENLWNGNIPFVTPADLQKTKHIFSTERTVSQEGLTAVRGQVLPSGAICVSCIGNLGYTAMTTQTSVSNQQINSIIPGADFDKNFVYYLTKSLWDEFKNLEGQSTTLSILNKTLFSKMEVIVPDLSTQQKIAEVLSSLDDKIELNTQINHNLEEQAKAILDQNCLAHKTLKVGDIVSFANGFAFKSSTYIEKGKFKVVTIKNVQDGKIDTSSADCVHEIPAKMKAECILNIGDVLLSLTGNVGRTGIVCENNLLLNQRVAKIIPHQSVLNAVCYFIFRRPEMKAALETIARGTAQANLSPVETLDIEIPFDIPILKDIAMCMKSFFEQIISNEMEIQKLAQLRDALLPKLMSGEIDVSEVQV